MIAIAALTSNIIETAHSIVRTQLAFFFGRCETAS